MRDRRRIFAALALLLAPLPSGCAATAAIAAPEAEAASAYPIGDDAGFTDYDIRARQLVAWLNGDLESGVYFSDYFRRMVPDSQTEALRASLLEQHGRALNATVTHRESDHSGTLDIRFAEAVASFDLVLDPQEPYRVAGLLLTGVTVPNDSYDAVSAEFDALPGNAGFAVAEIREDGSNLLAGREAGTQFAVGSAFKLYVLAELAAEIREGDSDWASVVPLGRASLPSGIMQDWPKAMPVTQATLATAMISLSDNSATDTLIAQLGRDQIGARLAKIGHSDPARALPILTTLEAFALKVGVNADARTAFLALPEGEQGAFLDSFGAVIDRSTISDAELVGGPKFIDSVEWFASPADMVALLTYLKRLDDPFVREILSINPGVGKSDAARWAYLGYKGGSEPGVVNMSFVGQRPDGQWMAVTGSWNDSAAPVAEAAFGALMARLLNVAVAAQ